MRIILSIIILFLSISTSGDLSTEAPKKLSGMASFYADKFEGKRTASGEIFSNDELTCAHKTLPFGTLLKVSRPGTEKWVIVRVNDRGPFSKNRLIDVSKKAALELDMVRDGLCAIEIELVAIGDGAITAPNSGTDSTQVPVLITDSLSTDSLKP